MWSSPAAFSRTRVSVAIYQRLSIAWSPDDCGFALLRAAFDKAHEETFGFADPANTIEIVNVRLTATGLVERPELDLAAPGGGDALIERRSVWFDGWVETPVLDRERLSIGTRFDGPAIVEEPGGTSVVPPGWRVEVHPSGALLCTAPA